MRENNELIRLQEVKYVSPKISNGLQILMVISGVVTVETNERYYYLEKTDLLVINYNQLYEIKGSAENRIIVVNIPNKYLEQLYPAYRQHRFECYSKEVDMGRKHLVNSIRKLLAEMLISYYRKDEIYQLEMQSNMSKLLLVLIRGFKQRAKQTEKYVKKDERIANIVLYIEENYKHPITLESVANEFFISPGYLSRYFKQKMEIGFNQFLAEIRFKQAVKDLLYTTKSIGQIAIDNGFPSAKSFAAMFKKKYSETPKIYREQHQKHVPDRVEVFHPTEKNTYQMNETWSVLKELQQFLHEEPAQTFNNAGWQSEELIIDVSPSKLNGEKIVFPKQNIAIGELIEILRVDIRTQLKAAKKDLNIKYVTIEQLIHGSTIIPPIETDERLATTSPYYNIDFALNFLKKLDLSLFVNVSYQEISTNEEHFFQELRSLLKHCIHIHGNDFVESWHFMFYEPYITAVRQSEMVRVYHRFYETVKSISPHTNVGVFLPYSYELDRTGKNHEWILESDVPIDFFGYEANQNEVVDFEKLDDERFGLTESYIIDKTKKLKAFLRKNRKVRPLHLVSWNTLTGNTRYTNGMFFRGALVFKSAIEIASEVETIGFWINTEQHESKEKNRNIRLEGMELFHYFSGKRPAYFATMFLSRLEGTVIAKGYDYIMTKTVWGHQLVLMNLTTINPYYSTEETLLKKLNKDIRVTITNIEPGEYQIRKRVFDKDHGALYSKWENLNSRYGIDNEIVQYIIETSQPSLQLFDKTFKKSGSFIPI